MTNRDDTIGMSSGDVVADVSGFDVADWLSLAAAPVFAFMALLTAILGGGAPDFLCAAMLDASPMGGMITMYALMSAFHLTPWLKLFSRRRKDVSRR